MILILFIIMVIFGLILFAVGISQESFPMAYLSMFVFILLGLFLLSDGLDITTGQNISGTTAPITVTDIYTTYTAANNVFIALLGYFFFYGALGATLLTTYFAFSGEGETEFTEPYNWQ